jgi:hypothetical protein
VVVPVVVVPVVVVVVVPVVVVVVVPVVVVVVVVVAASTAAETFSLPQPQSGLCTEPVKASVRAFDSIMPPTIAPIAELA